MKPQDVMTRPKQLEALGSAIEELTEQRAGVLRRAGNLASRAAKLRDVYNKRRRIDAGRKTPNNSTGVLVLERRQGCLVVGCLDVVRLPASNGQPARVGDVTVKVGLAYTAKRAAPGNEPTSGVGWEQVGEQIMRVEWLGPDESTKRPEVRRLLAGRPVLATDEEVARGLLTSMDESITAFTEAMGNPDLNPTLTPPED